MTMNVIRHFVNVSSELHARCWVHHAQSTVILKKAAHIVHLQEQSYKLCDMEPINNSVNLHAAAMQSNANCAIKWPCHWQASKTFLLVIHDDGLSGVQHCIAC